MIRLEVIKTDVAGVFSSLKADDFEELHEIAISKGIREYNAMIDKTSPYYKMKLVKMK